MYICIYVQLFKKKKKKEKENVPVVYLASTGWMSDHSLFSPYSTSLGILGTELLFSPLQSSCFSDYSEKKRGGGGGGVNALASM